MSNHEQKPLGVTFKTTGSMVETKEQDMELPVQYYAVATNTEIVKRFEIRLRSGEIYSIPYALLPIITLKNGNEIEITAYGLSITVQGRNLLPVFKCLSQEFLTWLKESPSGKDDEESECFISSIHVSSDSFGG